MANKKFILQGFTTSTHKNVVTELFGVEDIQRVIISVAFVNLGGVKLLETSLKKHAAKTTAFIGIRNEITSIQAAKRLFSLGITLYVVDTGSRRVIYHPKVYLVRGKINAKLIIGSANLTPGGLNNNIEASVFTDCDMTDATDRLLVESIESIFNEQPTEHPKNVLKITDEGQLDVLYEKGLLIDETIAAPPRPATSGSSPENDSVPRIRLKVTPIRIPISAAKKAVAKTIRAKKVPAGKAAVGKNTVVTAPEATGVEFERVWESKELTRRDLDVPLPGKNTNRTGSINLDKGLLDEAIDHRHYFRDDVFDSLNWLPGKHAKVEEAYAKVLLVIKGISYGEFNLRIAHSTNTASTTYKQRNAMTRLSWGAVRNYVARPDLIGRSLILYRDKADPTRFILEID